MRFSARSLPRRTTSPAFAVARSAPVAGAAAALVVGALAIGGCGGDEGSALDTLPPIRTTTSTTSTTVAVDERIRLYVVKEGENLSMIARAFEVPLDTLIDYNADEIGDPNTVQPGTTLEIPPVILFDELPTPSSSTSEPEP